ncbi:hypothetical protein ABH14_16450 [Brevibacillus brevis]|nr:hypothetical protein [Brevibacillus brevis]
MKGHSGKDGLYFHLPLLFDPKIKKAMHNIEAALLIHIATVAVFENGIKLLLLTQKNKTTQKVEMVLNK